MPEETVLVTGATNGIGRQTALELARRGMRVLLHGRSAELGEKAVREVQRASGSAAVEFVQADFSSMRQAAQLADEVRRRAARLDVVISNAATYQARREVTEDGLEMTFAVNHLAPFVLITRLLDLLQASAPARVIVVSSGTHQSARFDEDNLQGERGYDGHRAYALSKLANVLFTLRLARMFEPGVLTANCLNPGVIETNLLRAGWGGGGRSLEAGAATPVYLATASEVAGITGQYFAEQKPARPSAQSRDEAAQDALWEISERLARRALGEAA